MQEPTGANSNPNPSAPWASTKWSTPQVYVSAPGGGVLTYISYTGMCRPNGLLFHQKSLDMGPILVKKSLEEGPISLKFLRRGSYFS